MSTTRERRWAVGDEFEVDGFAFRVARGDKHPDDQQLWVRQVEHDWCLTTLALPYAVMDVIGQNEDVLYEHGAGGGKTHRALLTAYRDGWRVAWVQLCEERAQRDEKRRQARWERMGVTS